jgi:hypothetical protein
MKEMEGALGNQYPSNFLYPFILGSSRQLVGPRMKITFPAAVNAFMRNQASNDIPHLHRCHLRQTRDNSSSAGQQMQIAAKNLWTARKLVPWNYAALKGGPL